MNFLNSVVNYAFRFFLNLLVVALWATGVFFSFGLVLIFISITGIWGVIVLTLFFFAWLMTPYRQK